VQPGSVSVLTPVAIAVNPAAATLSANQTQQLTATVTGGSGNTAVNWSLSPNLGTIGATGLYTAPASIATQQLITVTATSAADATKSASASMRLLAPVSVMLSPAAATLSAGQTQQLTATVTGGSGNTAVNWSISPNLGTIGATGLYTAPASITTQQLVTVTAISAADATKSASASMTLLAPVSVIVSPAATTLSANQTQQLTATVTGGSGNTAVNWSINPNLGTIGATGLYTAPASITTQQLITVTAVSAADATKSASASMTLLAPVSVIVSPAAATLSANQTQQLTATVTGGSGNTAVNWSISPNVGTIGAAGLYTAPASITTQQLITVTAISAADATKSASASMTLLAPVSVMLSPAAATLSANQTQQLTATVTGGSGNTAVNWSINPNLGTIGGTGLYTAPASITTQQLVTVTATSAVDATKSASASMTLLAPVSVMVSPAAATLSAGQTQQLTATVTGGSGNTAVNWSLNPNLGTIGATGLYTAPASITTQQLVTVTAISAADATKSSSASMTLLAPVSVMVSPAAATLSAGQTQQLTATVTGGSGNTAVNWSLNPNLGTIGATGLYTAPASIATQQLITVTAVSAADATKSASASMTLSAPVSATAASATFVNMDKTTQGNWRGVYGVDGYVVVWNQTSNPVYVSPVAAGQSMGAWANSTIDVRGLQKPSNPTDRVAGAWYQLTPFTIDLNISDTAQHQIALYCVDWDTANRRQTVDILDGNGNVLNTQSLTTSFHGGVYLVWNVSGHVKVRVTWTAGSNAVVTGLFFSTTATSKISGLSLVAPPASPALALRRAQPATTVVGNDGAAVTSRPQSPVSGLACWPRVASAGSQISCEVQVPSSSSPSQLSLTSSSDQVKLPAVVATRPNQSSLTFQVSVEPDAKQQTAIVAVALADSRTQDTIAVVPGTGPVLTAPAKQVVAWGVPVSFNVIAVDPEDLPVQLAAGQLPVGASFDPASGAFAWVPNESQQGKYSIAFTATNSAHQSTSAETALVVDAGTPALTTPQPVNCSPNAIGSAQGKSLAATGAVLSEPSGSALEVGGVAVRINGQAVPVLFSSATKVSFFCPALDPGTQLSLVVETPVGRTEPLIGAMQAASPTIFSLDGSGQGQGLVWFLDTGDLAMERNYRVAGHPAQPGDEVVIWATGLGWATPPGAVLVKIGGVYAGIESVQPVSGHAGLSAIQVRLPAATPVGDAVPVQLELSTPDSQQISSNIVTAAFESIRQ